MVEEVRWDKGGNELADDYAFFVEKYNGNHLMTTLHT